MLCYDKKPRLYQVGNTSSHKNTEDKQLGPRLALGWLTNDHSRLDDDAIATKKSLMRKVYKNWIKISLGFQFGISPYLICEINPP